MDDYPATNALTPADRHELIHARRILISESDLASIAQAVDSTPPPYKVDLSKIVEHGGENTGARYANILASCGLVASNTLPVADVGMQIETNSHGDVSRAGHHRSR